MKNLVDWTPQRFWIWAGFEQRWKVIRQSFFNNGNCTNDIGFYIKACHLHYESYTKYVLAVVFYVFQLGVNHGFLLRGVTVTVFRGVCLSSMRFRVELKNCTRESRSRFSTLEKAAAISLLRLKISIFLSWRQENVVLWTICLGRSWSMQIVLWFEM